MAVKKAPVKQAVAKKTVAKKVAPVKKAVAKTAPVKKAVAKKAFAKKVVPVKQAAVKQAVVKKAPVKKAVAKKAVAKKVPAKKVAAATIAAPIVYISSLPTPTFADSLATIIPVTRAPITPSVPVLPKFPTPTPTPTPKSSSRVLLWVIIGIVAIAMLVVIRNHKATTSTPDTTATPTVSAAPSTSPTHTSSPATMDPASATPSAAGTGSTPTTTSDLAPVGIVAHYTSTGARIFWRLATGSKGLTTYKVQAASNGGAFKLIATIPSTQLSIDLTESDTNGWTSFKISAIYSDGNTIVGKVFGLPGQYA